MKKEQEYVAKTLHGLEEVLADELNQLGAVNVVPGNRVVTFQGNKRLMYKANMFLRTALKILKPIHKFKAKTNDELYKGIQQVYWSSYMDAEDTLAVEAVVNSDHFNHSQFVALKSKDAIVDQFRNKTGMRPSVETKNPDLQISVHINNDICTVLVDSSGEPLFKRGYRVDGNIAPLNEVLAAGMILLSGWDGKSTFIDPMCGSGTLLIEAALFAMNIPPCINRSEFAFEKWKDFDEDLWEDILDEADKLSAQRSKFHHKIIGGDVSGKAYRIAQENIGQLFLNNKIDLSVGAVEDFEPPEGGGMVITNPPYGERIKKEDINSFYQNIGSRMKHSFTGYDVWILSGNPEAAKHIGLHPSKKITLYNGSIECKFMKFSMYEGSKRQK